MCFSGPTEPDGDAVIRQKGKRYEAATVGDMCPVPDGVRRRARRRCRPRATSQHNPCHGRRSRLVRHWLLRWRDPYAAHRLAGQGRAAVHSVLQQRGLRTDAGLAANWTVLPTGRSSGRSLERAQGLQQVRYGCRTPASGRVSHDDGWEMAGPRPGSRSGIRSFLRSHVSGQDQLLPRG